MHQAAELFADFTPVSKEIWLAQIAKDLKGKPLEELYWHLNDELTIDPFGHADDFNTAPVPLFSRPTGWEINEDIEARTPVEVNKQALEALSFGVESLCFSFEQQYAAAVLEEAIEGVHLSFISLHFIGRWLAEAPAAVLYTLARKAREQNIPAASLRGSLYYSPDTEKDKIQDWRYLVEMVQYAQAELPGFRCLSVDCRPDFKGIPSIPDELAAALYKGAAYLERLTARGLNPDEAAAQIQFTLYVGKSYFVEIAKLRALHLLWINLLKAWGAKPVYPVLDVRFTPDAYTDDLYTNMIRATTMAMSAVLGGASRVTVRPYDSGREDQATYPAAFSRRVARNIQHLLKSESGFETLHDPAAGSYYIEKLTAQLAHAAWAKLKTPTF